MDLFNKKKLSEKEAEIGALLENGQRLEKKLSQLEAQIIELKEEKQRENILHKDVVDTMLGEIQSFMVDNYEKKLSFKTLDTLLPLIEENIDTNYLIINIEIIPPIFLTTDKQIISLSKQFCEGWVSEGLIKTGVVQDFYVNQDDRKETKVVSRTIYSADDLILKLKSLFTDIYNVKAGKGAFKPEKFSIEKVTEENISVFVNYNKPRNRYRGF